MSDCITFPDDWREFVRDYSFKDSDEVYTNGSELIPVFRVEQLIEHLLAKQEPRVLTLDEFMAHWKLPPQERPPIWEEWKIDKGKGRWKLYGRGTGGYGTLWRCWTARPTNEQRESVKWVG